MKYFFILNPHSGTKKIRTTLIGLIDKSQYRSIHSLDFAVTTRAGEATQLARQAANAKYDVAVAVGGDGTVNEVASGLVHSNCALGVIPLGSGNGFARSLKIPLSVNKSLHALFSPAIRAVDIGMANSKYFIGVAGTGYDALVGKKFQTFGIRGPIPYFLIGIKEYLRYKCQTYQIEIDGESFEETALLLAFANTKQYGNGAIIAPEADPADGCLDFCLIKSLPALDALVSVSMVFKGQIHHHPSYFSKKCKSVNVRVQNQKMFLHRDGEPEEISDQLEISLLPAALRVCTPQDNAEGAVYA
jgi:YegS/Rv2252/BmrU family lipid kinase